MLEAFRGRCSFRQYIRNKPAKYGIKIFALVDSVCYYTVNLEVYVGKQPSHEFSIDNRPYEVVLRLSQPISKTGRNITMDNWFSSIPLAEELLKNQNLTMVGTLRRNKRELPPIISAVKIEDRKRPVGTSMFLYKDDIVVTSYVAKKNKVVILLSTLHDNDEVDPITQKPLMILDYNRFKGGVDTVDEMKGSYSVARNSRRWPLTVFFSLLNIGAINSQVIYKHNNTDEVMTRSKFLKNLAQSLVYDQMKIRVQLDSIPFSVKLRLQQILKLPPPEREERREGRCFYCGRHRGNRTKKKCQLCKRFVCGNHVAFTCRNCLDNAEDSG